MTNEDINANYCQVVPMTFEERVAMYMKCSKLDLARMLAERDSHMFPYVPNTTPYVPEPYPCPINPQSPFDPQRPWWEYYQITCTSATTMCNGPATKAENLETT